MIALPGDRRYSPDDVWARREGPLVRVGVTPVVAAALRGVRVIALPRVGERIHAGAPLCTIEDDKATLAVFAPCDGRVSGVNEAVIATPALLVGDPLGAGWLCLLEGAGDFALLGPEAYARGRARR